MSGVKVTNQSDTRAVRSVESVDATVDDEDYDWEPDVTTGIPPGNDEGDVLTWDGDSWGPAPGPTGTFTLVDHGNMGSTETLDLDDGDWHRGTLDADCTITVAGFVTDEPALMVVKVTQDGTGGWGITWDTDVEFGTGDDQPELGAGDVTYFGLFSDAGSSSIYGKRLWPVSGSVDVADSTVTVSAASTIRVPDGGVDDAGGGEARLRFLLSRGGGRDLLATVASSGTAQALDLEAANVFDVTLDDDCTFTFSNPPASGTHGRWTIILRGTDLYTVTWPGTVSWRDTDGSPTATPPTLTGEQNVVVLATLDGGTSYGASVENGSGGAGEPTADAHIADTSDAHDASAISIADSGGYFTATDVEAALQEIGAGGIGGSSAHYEILMASGSADPLLTSDGLDYLYVEVL